ncbi:obscurin-like_isoform X4 [Hexamita inflata]|uniref:Obscurin-like isoform X4 n=1 Tax=Hexamita inflata TaxID=28002 RepID=A0AA86REX0_9EUKA|nr:obscurin-like isoform X4 [Hexamita inflata]
MERLKIIQKENEKKQAEEEKQRLRQEAEEIKRKEEEEKRRIQEAEEARILEQQKEAMRLYQQEIEEQKKKVEQQQLLDQQKALENNVHEHTQETNNIDNLETNIQINALELQREQQKIEELNNIKFIEEQKKIEQQQRIQQEQDKQTQQALEKQRKLEEEVKQQQLDMEKLLIIRKQQQDNDKINVKEAKIITNQNLTVQHQLKDKAISQDQIILSQIEMQINQESKQFEFIKYYYNQEQNQVNIPKYNFKQYQINDLKIDINELLSLKYVYDVLEFNNQHLNKNQLQINQNNQIDIKSIQNILTEEEIKINQQKYQCIKCNQQCDISITQKQIAPLCQTCESKQISYIQLQTLFSAQVRNIKEFQDIFEIEAITEIKRVINLYVKSCQMASSFISIHDILSEMTQSQLTPSSNVNKFAQYLQSQDHKFKLNIPLQLSSFKGAQGYYSLTLLEILAQRSSIHNQCSICMFNIQILQYDQEILIQMIKERIFGWKICVKCLRFAHHVCQNGEFCNDCK